MLLFFTVKVFIQIKWLLCVKIIQVKSLKLSVVVLGSRNSLFLKWQNNFSCFFVKRKQNYILKSAVGVTIIYAALGTVV